MLSISFLSILIAIPAAMGAYMASRQEKDGDFSSGFGLVLYAFALTACLAYFWQTGNLSGINYGIAAPASFLAGIGAGALVGFAKRSSRSGE